MPSYEVSPDGIVTFNRTKSELAQAILCIRGKPLRLDPYYPMYQAIYDGRFKSRLLMTSRQVAKSTTLSVDSITDSVAIPHFSTLFLAPTAEQTQKFSTQRVGKIIQYSPLIQKYYLAEKASERVLLRTFSNGSEINFSYVLDDPDRARGISADHVAFDECQDMLIDVVAPVVKETMRDSRYHFTSYCGTPKTMENGIQSLWEGSTQTEWLIKCGSCNKYNCIRSEKSFGPNGPICLGCGSLLDPRNGQWVDAKPNAKNKGFHISRPMMPGSVPACWRVGSDEYNTAVSAWDEIWDSLQGPNKYPISTFRNEVIGVSDSQGRRIITIDKLRSMCTGPQCEQKPNTNTNMKDVIRVVASIDWSGGGTEEKSFTVLTVWGLLTGSRYRLLYFKMFTGANPIDEVNEIISTLSMYGRNLSFISGDAGEGNVYIDILRKKFGDTKVIKLRYVDSSYYACWDQKAKAYNINRTRSIDSLMMALYRNEFEFPKDNDGAIMAKPFKHILAEHEEVTGQSGGIRKKVWRHSPNDPDDFLHATNFGRIAMQLAIGELDLTASVDEKD